jgi:hypothetical protein
MSTENKMSTDWLLVDADLGRYHHTKFKSGGRLYFIKGARKNVSVYDIAFRKNVSIKMSALPSLYFNTAYEDKLLRLYPKTFKNLLKNFRVYKQKTKQEKNILDTLKIKSKINYKNV